MRYRRRVRRTRRRRERKDGTAGKARPRSCAAGGTCLKRKTCSIFWRSRRRRSRSRSPLWLKRRHLSLPIPPRGARASSIRCSEQVERARSRRGLQAPRNLADPLSRLTAKGPKEVGLWDNAEVRGRVADAAKSLKVEASIASRPAPAASLPLRDDPAPREKGAEESFDLGSLGHSLSGGRHSSPRFSPPIAPVTGKPRVDRERKRRNAVFNSPHRLDSPHRLALWGEGVRVTPSLSLSPRHVLDKYDLSDPDGPSFEETHATDDLQFQLDMEWDPVGHHAATRGERRDDVATPELSSDGAEESPVRLRSNRISAASPRFTSRFIRRRAVQCGYDSDELSAVTASRRDDVRRELL